MEAVLPSPLMVVRLPVPADPFPQPATIAANVTRAATDHSALSNRLSRLLEVMPPVWAARCCQHVSAFRYAGDMRRLREAVNTTEDGGLPRSCAAVPSGLAGAEASVEAQCRPDEERVDEDPGTSFRSGVGSRTRLAIESE
jgi:hypothetical protein